MIHTANPVEHANHMAAQPQFVHPEHRSFVDLSGHNLANPHPFAGRTGGPSPLPAGAQPQPQPQLRAGVVSLATREMEAPTGAQTQPQLQGCGWTWVRNSC